MWSVFACWRRARRCWLLVLVSGASPRLSARATCSSASSRCVLALCATVAILTTIGIVFSVARRDLPVLLRSGAQRAARRSPSSCSAPSGTRRRRCAPIRATSGRHSASFRCWSARCSSPSSPSAWPARSACSRRYICRSTPRRAFRAFAKPVLEILAGIPTVVLGFFAALTVAPLSAAGASTSASTSPPRARSPPASSWA